MATVGWTKSSPVQQRPKRPDATEGAWMLDRHINLSVIFAVVVQTVGLVMWGTTLTARVGELENKMQSASTFGERLVRIETATSATQEVLRDLKSDLKGWLSQPPKR